METQRTIYPSIHPSIHSHQRNERSHQLSFTIALYSFPISIFTPPSPIQRTACQAVKEQIQQTKMGAVKRRLTAELVAARNKLQKALEEKVEMEEEHRAEVKKLKVCAT